MNYSIYCDESCHLEGDHHPIMVLGAVWCPTSLTRAIFNRIREIKIRNGLSREFEVKWTKVSPSKNQIYRDLLDYFFDDDHLHFRCLVAENKYNLQHTLFGQDHDTWYYKMYFNLLKVILSPHDTFRIYLDIKDTRSESKVAKLRDVLSNNMYDFQRRIIERIQTVRSHEVELIQLADLLTGTISYLNRGISTNEGKLALVTRMQERSGYQLTQTTLLKEEKLNLFKWKPVLPKS
ncbi:MAG TPA: DUF3800 domain-containing protein [Candidatus Deferrimicrobium sp.]|nr:DUF3800 domain-containing protein [Candidatus Deferrimicrobium sp.]